MKLIYVKLRNVLSFGDEEVKLEFGPFNIIAGPNDAGKTNLFRALSIIEKSFGYGKLPLEETLFQGDFNRSLNLEVGLELEETELELLSAAIICSEIMRIEGQGLVAKGIQEKSKRWKSILIEYGLPILTKSFRYLSVVLRKDKLRVSDQRIEIQLSEGTDKLFIDIESHLSETSRNLRTSYQTLFFAEEIVDEFNTRFGELPESEISSLLEDKKRLFEESPLLTKLLKGKLAGPENKVMEFRRFNLWDYSNHLSEEPIFNKLSMLRELKELKPDQLYIWGIIEQIYKNSFVKLKELRFFPSAMTYSGNAVDAPRPEVVGTDLSMTLFKLMTSSAQKDKKRYNIIKQNFRNLTDLEFEVAIRGKETQTPSDELGVMPSAINSLNNTSQPEFFPLGYKHQIKKRILNEAYVQVIKDNYPIPIEETASGIHEILLLLTAIIGESQKIVLLDEPELHLHPTMQKRILNLISESSTKENNQIILITHSPYLTSAEEINATWRFSATNIGTKVHNLGKVLSNLENRDQQKIALNFSNPVVRAVLFSHGVILVEGPSDKIVVEQVDKFLSAKQKDTDIDESEWPIVEMGGKDNLPLFMKMCQILGVSSLAIVDIDALMGIGMQKIVLDNKKVKTSTVFFALWSLDKLVDSDILNQLRQSNSNGDPTYASFNFNAFRLFARKNGIFVLSKDLEGILDPSNNCKTNKPLMAVGLIFDLIKKDNIPSELIEMREFLKEHTETL
jgi:ABC-type lipoprotein export system ATPase subunit